MPPNEIAANTKYHNINSQLDTNSQTSEPQENTPEGQPST